MDKKRIINRDDIVEYIATEIKRELENPISGNLYSIDIWEFAKRVLIVCDIFKLFYHIAKPTWKLMRDRAAKEMANEARKMGCPTLNFKVLIDNLTIVCDVTNIVNNNTDGCTEKID